MGRRWRRLCARLRRRSRRPTGLSVHEEPPVDGDEILQRLVALPVSLWSYDADDPTVRHLGPMAQDFAQAFHLGSSDRHIAMVDANGVNVVAIQALHRRLQDLARDVEALRSRLDAVEEES